MTDTQERVPSERAASCECHGMPKCPSRGPARTVARLMEDAMKIARIEDQGASAVGASSHEAAIGSPATRDQTEARPTPRTDAMRALFDNAPSEYSALKSVADILNSYETLEREAADLQAHCDRLTGMKFSDRMHAALVSRVESAERALAEARAKERARWDLYCLRRAAEYCYDVPVECNTPETQDARDRTRAAIHKRILELLGERSALTDEAKP